LVLNSIMNDVGLQKKSIKFSAPRD
jgi:hypothetical protein